MPEDFPYEDIVNRPHPTSPTRPRMPALNRAAQFAPFAALSGYGDVIDEAARLTGRRIELSEAEKSALGEKLARLKARLAELPRVSVTYFVPDGRKEGGAYVTVSGTVTKIREFEQTLVIDRRTEIAFGDILEIT